MNRFRTACLGTVLAMLAPQLARADSSFAEVAEQVNKKMVKLFGPGGFSGVASYGTGILVSSDGYILTAASPLLEAQELRIHLFDGRRFHARVIVAEPELDLALVKIDKVEALPYFDVSATAKTAPAQPGDWVLAFSNEFRIATGDEPLSLQHSIIAAYSKLRGRRGVFEAPYSGDVYVLDAITNNPGAAGGALTTRHGELLGILGKELRNTLTDTWINYAIPVQATVDVATGDKITKLSLVSFVERAKRGEYKPVVKERNPQAGPGGYHGIVLVPNVVERTPPFVEAIEPNSPAARAGLKADDLIVYVDGEAVANVKSFRELLGRTRPGTELQLEVRRVDRNTKVDKLVTLKLKLDEPHARGAKK